MKNKLKMMTLLTIAVMILAACTPSGGNNGNKTNNTNVSENNVVENNSKTTEESKPVEDNAQKGDDIRSYKTDFQTPREEYLKAYPDGQVEEISFEKKGGSFIYKIKGQNSREEQEIEVNPETKEVLSVKLDEKDDDEDIIDFSNLLLVEEALEKASDAIGENGVVTKWKLSEDDGKMKYTFDVKKDGKDIEIKVNAVTGEIIEIDD